MYNDALVLLDGSHKLLQSYCLMKLNRLEEALNLIKEENGLQERLLTAQILNNGDILKHSMLEDFELELLVEL